MITVTLPVNPLYSSAEEAECARGRVEGTSRELTAIALSLRDLGLSAHGRMVADLSLCSRGGICRGTLPLHIAYNVWTVARELGLLRPGDERSPL